MFHITLDLTLHFPAIIYVHRRNLGGARRVGGNAPPIFFLPKNRFLASDFKGGQINK